MSQSDLSSWTVWCHHLLIGPLIHLSLLVSFFSLSFTRVLVQKLPNQFHKKAVEVDNHLRVIGAPAGSVYAIGDAATVCPSLVFSARSVFPYADTMQSEMNADVSAACVVRLAFIQIETGLVNHLLELFDQVDENKDNKM